MYNKYYLILSQRRLRTPEQIISASDPHTISSYYQFINALPIAKSVTNAAHTPDLTLKLSHLNLRT
jgi:hypothetical protein